MLNPFEVLDTRLEVMHNILVDIKSNPLNNVTHNQSTEEKSKFANAKKAGELFGVHPNTIRNWYKSGQIEKFIKSQALVPV